MEIKFLISLLIKISIIRFILQVYICFVFIKLDSKMKDYNNMVFCLGLCIIVCFWFCIMAYGLNLYN